MSKIMIVVEGLDDLYFLAALLRGNFPTQQELEKHIPKKDKEKEEEKGNDVEKKMKTIIKLPNSSLALLNADGKDGLGDFKTTFPLLLEEGFKFLFVFDADGNADQARQNIKKQLEIEKSSYDIFLFPDDENSGDLESLLLRIAKPEKIQSVQDCHEKFHTCLKAINEEKFGNLESDKRKKTVYSYVLQHTSKNKATRRDLWNGDLWDFENEALKPLREFLIQNLGSNDSGY